MAGVVMKKKSDFQHRLVLASILAALMVGNSGVFSHDMKTIILSISIVVILFVSIRIVYRKVKANKS